MERILRDAWKSMWVPTLIILGVLIYIMERAQAGVVMLPPPPKLEISATEYPESKFGTAEMETGRTIASVGSGGGAKADGGSKNNDLVTSARKGVQEVALIAGDLGFFPKTVFVSKDTPVRLFVTGASKSSLCMMMDTFNVRKQIRSQRIEEINFTPTIPGTFRFYCPINGSEGTLVVREIVTE